MASEQPIFDLILSGNGSISGGEVWVDLGAITTGKQMFIGYATFCNITAQNGLVFEIRTNNVGASASTTAATYLLDSSGAQMGDSVDRDLYFNGNINTFAPINASTGVEHWWLRITQPSASTNTFQYIFRYTIQ